jgi:hypothetical protein
MKHWITIFVWAIAISQPLQLRPATPEGDSGRPMAITFMPISHEDKDVDARLDALKSLGVTSIQTYIYWNKVEKTPGVLDWSEYDADVAVFRKHGLKWVPFVIIGPWYVTPEFVRQDPRIVRFRCLEHDRESAMPSIWCERTREYVRTYLRAFAEHYRPMGVIESVDLGITGDYGEAIYSVIGNWPGAYHSHVGYWCGDALAVADFRRAMRNLYPGGIAAFNLAWHSRYASFDEVKPFLPTQAPSEHAWQELLRWYRGAMTSYADFCLASARDAFPDSDLYLCTGGDMAPEHGSDFSAQAQAAARYHAGVRITNEASSFPMNLRLTRMVDSAARFYGAYVGHEPANTVTPTGMLGRIFNAVTSGARQFFFYDTPEVLVAKDGRYVPGESGTYLQRCSGWLKTVHARVETAVYYPNPYSRETKCDRQDFSDLASQIRRFIDYDFVDDRLIQDGALRGKSILIVAGAEVMDAATASRIEQWTREGGIVFVLDRRSTDWDGQTAAFDQIAGFTSQSDETQAISDLVVEQPKALPSIAALSDVTGARGYTGLQADCEPLLVTRYDPKVEVAWRRKIGSGVVFAYYGPMDLKQYEENWMVAHKLPLRFIRDCLATEVAAGTIKNVPPTLNLGADDLYKVQTDSGLWILNVGREGRKIEEGGVAVEVPALSIVRR